MGVEAGSRRAVREASDEQLARQLKLFMPLPSSQVQWCDYMKLVECESAQCVSVSRATLVGLELEPARRLADLNGATTSDSITSVRRPQIAAGGDV